MFRTNNIRRRVLERVEERISQGQEEYDVCVEREDQILSDGISALTETHKRNKQSHEERIVKGIIG